MSRTACAIYDLIDCEPDMAVVRAKDDEEVFWRHAAEHVWEYEWRYPMPDVSDIETLTDDQRVAWAKRIVQPPVWRWYRWNVLSREASEALGYRFSLDYRKGPGRGNWRGSLVVLKPYEERAEVSA